MATRSPKRSKQPDVRKRKSASRRARPAPIRNASVWRLVALALLVSQLPVLYVRLLPAPTTAFMQQRKSQARQEKDDNFSLDFRWVERERIGDALALAAMAAEDQRFVSHYGLDLHEVTSALLAYLNGERLRGASTITQQLAKNLFLWPGRSGMRKLVEFYYTMSLELLWSKARILETYLNVAEFGDGIYGVEAAAHHYFGRSARSLGEAEAAYLVCLLPAPKRYPQPAFRERVRRKQRWVLEQMAYLRATQALARLGWR